MIKLPERIRRTLERLVNQLKLRENVYGIGLFGSWSRGDADPSSDVDLLILDKGSFSDEYVERVEAGGLMIDLNHVPKAWLRSLIPPSLDQKLYEAQIVYDRDWSLTNTKLLMTKSYGSPERVDIRTEAHVIDSDVYLSRATSAFSRKDYRSAHVFATVALESILKVLIDIALETFSNSHLLEAFQTSATKLDRLDDFNEYLAISRLNKTDELSVKEKTRLFKLIWVEMNATARRHSRELESSHFKVKTRLNYYLNPAFLQGALARTDSLINSEKTREASHYLNTMLLDIVENYFWVKSSIEKVRVDLSTIICSLEILESKNPHSLNQIVDFFSLGDVGKPEAASAIEKTRRVSCGIRKDRKVLIKKW